MENEKTKTLLSGIGFTMTRFASVYQDYINDKLHIRLYPDTTDVESICIITQLDDHNNNYRLTLADLKANIDVEIINCSNEIKQAIIAQMEWATWIYEANNWVF